MYQDFIKCQDGNVKIQLEGYRGLPDLLEGFCWKEITLNDVPTLLIEKLCIEALLKKDVSDYDLFSEYTFLMDMDTLKVYQEENIKGMPTLYTCLIKCNNGYIEIPLKDNQALPSGYNWSETTIENTPIILMDKEYVKELALKGDPIEKLSSYVFITLASWHIASPTIYKVS